MASRGIDHYFGLVQIFCTIIILPSLNLVYTIGNVKFLNAYFPHENVPYHCFIYKRRLCVTHATFRHIHKKFFHINARMWCDWYILHRSKSDIFMLVSGGSSICVLFTCIEPTDMRLLSGTGLMLSPNSPLISDELSHIEFRASTAGTGDVSFGRYKS